MFQCGNYTAKLYNHTIPNKGNQVIDSKITINKKLKVRKLKDIHYNHQTLCILAKKRVNYRHNVSQTFRLTENH